jgi:gamma-glutamylcyclotransferase (GGCT)/AIG2-like uncharacterized protein YtfP
VIAPRGRVHGRVLAKVTPQFRRSLLMELGDKWDEMDADSQRSSAAASECALHRLATYGSLAPTGPCHHQLDGLEGRWLEGHVHGRLVNAGWGAGLGYPALILDPMGPGIAVQVFESVDLPGNWSRLDDFEGPGYQRILTSVRTLAGDVEAFIYSLQGDGP